MKTPQEQVEHPPTECCNYSAPITIPYPVMWNEFNKVVQCHNCGHVWVPKCPELIAVAKAANGLSFGSDWNNGTHAKYHGYRQKLIDALQALRATRKVEL